MEVIYGINKIRKYLKPVVALGVFDGVHLGHQFILRHTVAIAKKIGGTAVVFTFSPHPQRIESLCSLEHRLQLIGASGIKLCVVINFNRTFARMPAADFIKNVLVDKVGVRYICVGDNFRFGKDASGDKKLLKKLSLQYNFGLKLLMAVRKNGVTISSTFIRRLVKKGKIQQAEKLIGRRISILGSVVHGASLAKKLGFPTANLNPHHEVTPPSGVYAVKIVFAGRKYHGVCSIGNKPTLRKGGRQHIEVYIFNFRRNIYGKQLEVIFIKKIRPQKKFPTLSQLASQISKDITFTKILFSRHKSYHNI